MQFRRAEITTAALVGVATGIGLLAVGASLVTGVTPCSLLTCDKPAATATTVAGKADCADAAKSECTKGAEAVAVATKSECSKGAEAIAVAATSDCSAAKSACSGEAIAAGRANYRLFAFRGGFFPVAVPASFTASTTPANLSSACADKASTVAAKSECSEKATTVADKADCADKPDCCSDSCDDEKTEDAASGPIASKTPAN